METVDIGGILATINGGTNCLFTYDGNGNVADVLDETGTNTFAHFEYDPFGSVIRSQVSSLSPEIRWRFSSQGPNGSGQNNKLWVP